MKKAMPNTLHYDYLLRFFLSLFIISLIFILTACSVDVSNTPNEKYPSIPVSMQVQSMQTTPATGSIIIKSTELQAGDILLSRDRNWVSFGIRVATTSSVSHASIYIGNNQIAEAIGSGVQIVDLQSLLNRSVVVAVYRSSELILSEQAKIREFAELQDGKKYNFKGIVLMTPYMISRQFCELPPLKEETRNTCLSNMATVQLGKTSRDEQAFFCSQFVVEAYNYVGRPLTDADPVWISPDDLMHMREGDIKSITPHNELTYVGHLKVTTRPNLWKGM